MPVLVFLAPVHDRDRSEWGILVATRWAQRGEQVLYVCADPGEITAVQGDARPNIIGWGGSLTQHQQLLKLSKAFEQTVVDCSVGTARMSRTVLAAADLVVLPYEPSERAFAAALEQIRGARKHRPHLQVRILLTRSGRVEVDVSLRKEVREQGLTPLNTAMGGPFGIDQSPAEEALLAELAQLLSGLDEEPVFEDNEAVIQEMRSSMGAIERTFVDLLSIDDSQPPELQRVQVGLLRERVWISAQRLRSLSGLAFRDGETIWVTDGDRFLTAAVEVQRLVQAVEELLRDMEAQEKGTLQTPGLPMLHGRIHVLLDELRTLRGLS
jgi:hypothetical protein